MGKQRLRDDTMGTPHYARCRCPYGPEGTHVRLGHGRVTTYRRTLLDSCSYSTRCKHENRRNNAVNALGQMMSTRTMAAPTGATSTLGRSNLTKQLEGDPRTGSQ